MYKLNCIKWMFVCGLAFRISYVIIIGMSYLQYPHTHTQPADCVEVRWLILLYGIESRAHPLLSALTLSRFSFVINISWTFWWMSTWYIILWHADMRILPFQHGHNIWIITYIHAEWEREAKKGYMDRQRKGGGCIVKKLHFYFDHFVCVSEHTENCCKPADLTTVFSQRLNWDAIYRWQIPFNLVFGNPSDT